MSRRWRKLGLLYVPAAAGRHPKLLTHAANPLPVHLQGDVYRVFYSGRDARNRSSVGAVDIDILRREVVHDHAEPCLTHGPLGSFYADGVSIGNCYVVGGVRYMLFMGWQSPAGGHWRGDIGRLIVDRNLVLSLDGETPLMGSDATDPISLSYPWVEQTGEQAYSMWYGSTLRWDAGNDEMLHAIHHAVSADGHDWVRQGLAVPYAIGVAQAFSRPTVLRHADGSNEMWYSYRSGTGETYRIGYARSEDGIHWTCEPRQGGIDVSSSGWDADMIAYPYVWQHAGQHWMLYNGNGYGRSGFGLAVLSDG